MLRRSTRAGISSGCVYVNDLLFPAHSRVLVNVFESVPVIQLEALPFSLPFGRIETAFCYLLLVNDVDYGDTKTSLCVYIRQGRSTAQADRPSFVI